MFSRETAGTSVLFFYETGESSKNGLISRDLSGCRGGRLPVDGDDVVLLIVMVDGAEEMFGTFFQDMFLSFSYYCLEMGLATANSFLIFSQRLESA